MAELLQTLLAYGRGLGIDARWLVIDGNPEFFRVTKRIHNRLYGSNGDGGDLGPAERSCYEDTLEQNAGELLSSTRVGGIVDQIVDGQHGLLVDDPEDLEGFGAAINRVALRWARGARARE